MTWDYCQLSRHPVPAEEFEKEEELLFFCIIIKCLIQNLVNAFVPFVGFHVHVQAVLINLINIGLPAITPSSQPRYAHVENYYYNKIIDNFNYWITMKLLSSKKP